MDLYEILQLYVSLNGPYKTYFFAVGDSGKFVEFFRCAFKILARIHNLIRTKDIFCWKFFSEKCMTHLLNSTLDAIVWPVGKKLTKFQLGASLFTLNLNYTVTYHSFGSKWILPKKQRYSSIKIILMEYFPVA